MPGPWITQTQLEQALADTLKVDIADLQDYWQRIAAQALIDSTAYLTQLLLQKGYTSAQIDSWDYIVSYSQDYAIYLSLVKGGGLADFDPEFIKQLNRAPQLKDITSISIGGVMQTPAASDGAGVEAGEMYAGSIEEFDRTWHRRVAHTAYRPV